MANFIDLSGQKFGKLTAVNMVGKNKWGSAVWLCKCDCGGTKEVEAYNLKIGSVKSCGCLHKLDTLPKDLSGKTFNYFFVLKPMVKLGKNGRKSNGFLCRCKCGNEIFVRRHSLISGKVKSCGCFRSDNLMAEDLVGQKFGKLTVLSFDKILNKHTYWLCNCECGKITSVRSDQLKDGTTKSCGCFLSESTRIRNTTHSMSKTKFYKTWNGLTQRCSNKKLKNYNDYGGRGITFCDKWANFMGFYEDMYESFLIHLEKYGSRQTTLDRIDFDGNYCKENCRWATYTVQANNKRNTKKNKG